MADFDQQERQRKIEALFDGATTQYREEKSTAWWAKAGFYRVDVTTTGGAMSVHLTDWGISRFHVSRLEVGNLITFAVAVRDLFTWWTPEMRKRS